MSKGASTVKDLIEKCKNGDELAWQALFDQVAPLILSLCKREKLSREQSLDVMGQVSYQLVTNIRNIKYPQAIFSYIRIVTKRQIFDLFRKNKIEKDMEEQFERVLSTNVVNNPHQLFKKREKEEIIREALMSLPDKDYRLLHALFLDHANPSYEEIARRLGMPVSSIGPTRARSLEKLYVALKKMKFKF